jgi:hypothetical protein
VIPLKVSSGQRFNNCSWDYGLESRIFEENQQSASQTEIELNFGGFFQQIKVRQRIGRKDSIQTVIPTSRRLDSFLYEAAQNSSQIFKINIKKSKT